MVKINDEYFVDFDQYNMILVHYEIRNKIDIKTKKPTSERKECYTQIGFYKKTSELIQGLVRDATKRKNSVDEFSTLHEMIKYQNELYEQIIEICKGM